MAVMPPHGPQADPVALARSLEKFLAEHPRAALLDGGQVLFDLSAASYAISAEHGRCVLHLWSEERNLIRTVVGLEERKDKLCILVRRLGTARAQSLYLVPDRDRRTPASRDLSRKGYLRVLERALQRTFVDDAVQGLRSAMDLEHSFGPAYARGLLVRGQQAWAVIGAGAAETQATLDGILTLGILWLAHCRQHAGKAVCHGLRIIVPRGGADVTRARMAWLQSWSGCMGVV